jgi:hypothetical protein
MHIIIINSTNFVTYLTKEVSLRISNLTLDAGALFADDTKMLPAPRNRPFHFAPPHFHDLFCLCLQRPCTARIAGAEIALHFYSLSLFTSYAGH